MIPDPFVFMAMVFSIIVLLLVGGFIVTFPIARRLGNVMEEWLRDRKEMRSESSLALHAEMREMRSLLESHEARFQTMAERQQFLESLAEAREPAQLSSTPQDGRR
ncbi:MAG: hypothetical protein V3T97_06035 [Gemmatimonadota bacterium]